jgi:hypothetical protein
MSEADADLEHDDDHDQLALADPDDYHQSRRLKEIHQAREQVHKEVRNLEISSQNTGAIYTDSIQQLAHAVAMYAAELLPLAHHAGMVESGDIDLPDWHAHDDLQQTVSKMGIDPDANEPIRRHEAMAVFRRCNAILANTKPIIEAEENNEWEV